MDPDNELLERCSKLTLEDRKGNGRLKWFELKSNVVEESTTSSIFGSLHGFEYWRDLNMRTEKTSSKMKGEPNLKSLYLICPNLIDAFVN